MRIAVIGGGNMGAAIASGVVSRGVVAPQSVVVSHLKSGLTLPQSVRTTRNNVEAIADADLIVVAVKPWLLQSVLEELAPHIQPNKQAIASVVAGVSFDTMTEWLGDNTPALFRIIPNTAISIGQSVTFIAKRNTTPEQRAAVNNIFAAMGVVYDVEESQMSLATALASCGIAYALRYIEAASNAGVEGGMEAEKALGIVLETVQGAVEVLRQGGQTPEYEIGRVTTPGGITLQGLEALEQNGFSKAVAEGIKASSK